MDGQITRRSLLAASAALLAGARPAEARPLTKTQERALRNAVRGRVLTPGDGGYNGARVVFNRRWDGVRPPAVVRVRDSADVRAVVRWAERYDFPLVARSGGHGYSGNSTSNTAVVVDLRALNQISSRDGSATIGPAARTLAIYTALARRDVTIPAGSCPTVAIGGLVLGGGMGLAGRAFGLTLDRVTGMDVVTADGRRRRIDADEDLFWALRGGGGSFAIVTAIRLRTRRVDRAAFFRISYTGSAPYLTVQRRWAGGESSPRSAFAASSLYVGERLSARGRSAFVDAADSAGLILDAYGGAINRPRRGDTAFPHRDERFSVQVLSYASNASTRVKQARARIAPYGSGAYANYADPGLDDALRAYYGADLARLRRIKRQLDPANRFRPAQGIR